MRATPLTGNFKETNRLRAERDAAFRAAPLDDAIDGPLREEIEASESLEALNDETPLASILAGRTELIIGMAAGIAEGVDRRRRRGNPGD